MKMFIAYGKWSSVTGRKLVQETGLRRAKRWASYRKFKSNDDCILNWGASVGNGITEKMWRQAKAKILNHPDAIAANKDKHESLEKIQKAHLPAVPHDLIDNILDSHFPTVARTKNHFGGSGLWRCNNREELAAAKAAGANHCTKLIVKAAEYRVHVLLDKAVRIVRKVKAREDAIDLCRSHKNGWKFKKVADANVPEGLVDIAVKAVKAIGLQFGAVDIVVQKKTNKMFILEVNSVPGLDGSSLKDWTNAIKELNA